MMRIWVQNAKRQLKIAGAKDRESNCRVEISEPEYTGNIAGFRQTYKAC
jgi:hypothetical protein